MKKIICISLLACILIIGCKPKAKPLKDGYFRLTGTIKGLDNGQIYISDRNFGWDTIQVDNGAFVHEDTLFTRYPFYIADDLNSDAVSGRLTDYATLYLEPKVMQLDLEKGSLIKANLKGSKTQIEYADYLKKMAVIKKPYESLHAQLNKLYENTENNEDAIQEVYKKLEPFYKDDKNAKKTFIQENPNSYISLEQLEKIHTDIDITEVEKLLEGLSDSIKQLPKAIKVSETIKGIKATSIGAYAPDFASIDVNGNPLKLSDFKGNYLLLDFWGSWCKPCRDSHPHLREIYLKYKPKGFEILGLAADDRTQDKWKEAIEEDKVGIWKHILRGKPSSEEKNTSKIDLVKLYGVGAFPTKILLDPEGKIVKRVVGYDPSSTWLEDKLAEVYDK